MLIAGSADLRTDDTKLVRIARKLSRLEPKVLLRNFPSVEQIQDGGSELRAKVFSLEEMGFLKRKTVDPLNASEQDSPAYDTILIMLGFTQLTNYKVYEYDRIYNNSYYNTKHYNDYIYFCICIFFVWVF